MTLLDATTRASCVSFARRPSCGAGCVSVSAILWPLACALACERRGTGARRGRVWSRRSLAREEGPRSLPVLALVMQY